MKITWFVGRMANSEKGEIFASLSDGQGGNARTEYRSIAEGRKMSPGDTQRGRQILKSSLNRGKFYPY